MTETPDARLAQLHDWLKSELTLDATRVAPASVDASFRRYFRVWCEGGTYIVMDAPPARESVERYVTVARMLAHIGVHVPKVLAEARAQGFLLLTDLGTRVYLSELRNGSAQALYGDAMSALTRIQARGMEHAQQLPHYDRALLEREMNLMPEWFCGRHLRLELSASERSMLEHTFDFLVRSALEQPQVFVHRDYHSRNLMVYPGDNPGILDFQDAVRGAVTYDLVSLFKDCYVSWPRERVRAWVLEYRDMASAAGVDTGASAQAFVRWFDLIGVQRHIKVLGIFARLFHRDGKNGYLADLPLTLDYVRAVCDEYAALAPLGGFLESRVVPILAERTQQALGHAQ